MYFVYMLRCSDNSIYTGISNDINRRLNEHFSQGIKSAKYTYSHKPKQLEIYWQTADRGLASKLEYRLKKLGKKDKERLIVEKELELFFIETLSCDEYILGTKKFPLAENSK